MSTPNRLQHLIIRRLGPYIHPFCPGSINDVVFIVGCPRSGTTFIGEILSKQPNFFYLYEPYYIWRYHNSRLNIWGPQIHGQLHLTARDVIPLEARRFSQWFQLALLISGKPRLVEKNPLHVFRIEWLTGMFPNAKIIQIYRHGRDVALSLLKAIPNWDGFRDKPNPLEFWASQWNYLMFEDYASQIEALQPALAFTKKSTDSYARALFVWLCCVWEGIQATQRLGEEKILTICYENFLANPQENLGAVFNFLGEPTSLSTIAYANQNLHRRSIGKDDPNPEATLTIAGPLLQKLGYTL